jgi:hypothetical protein
VNVRDAVLQLAAALCYTLDRKMPDYKPRRVLLFENDERQFQGGEARLSQHHHMDGMPDPDTETKETIEPHPFFPKGVADRGRDEVRSNVPSITQTELSEQAMMLT